MYVSLKETLRRTLEMLASVQAEFVDVLIIEDYPKNY
jgi:hypothetical protein